MSDQPVEAQDFTKPVADPNKLFRALLREELDREGLKQMSRIFGGEREFKQPSTKAATLRAMQRAFNYGVAIGRASR